MPAMEAPPLERKLVAILAADVEGYSRLMHEDEERTLATLSSHRSVVDSAIALGRGEISGTVGDSVLAEFSSVVDAVQSAIAIQQQLAKANAELPSESQMHFRIGINVGDVMVKDGGIFGDGVNVAARLESIAEPGGICVTRGVRDHLRDRTDYEFEDLGEHVVKNIARPVRVFRVRFDPTDFDHNSNEEKLPKEAIQLEDAQFSASNGEDPVELAFWNSVQASSEISEYEVYLNRYPDGEFAALAWSRLERSDKVDEKDAVIELEFWNSIKESEIPAMFDAYLQKFPNGEFKSLAEIQLARLKTAEG